MSQPGFYRLKRKVLLVIVVIVVGPMGLVSATWVSRSFERSVEHWIREAAQVNENWLRRLQQNGLLFADILVNSPGWKHRLDRNAGQLSMPEKLEPLARELGINLIQVYSPEKSLVYSSIPVTMSTLWESGQSEAVLKLHRDGDSVLAAVAIRPIAQDGETRYYLVLGSLLDKGFLLRLNQLSGLRTRLFYPEAGDYAKAFSDSDRPLRVRLPVGAYRQLQNKQSYYSPHAENGRFEGLYTPITDTTGRVEAVLFAGLERDKSEDLLTHRFVLSGGIVLLGVLIGGVSGFLLSRIVVRPVEDLRNGVMQLAAQDFRPTVPVRSRDELGDLARAFNAMAESLREARDEQRREFHKDKIAALGELALALAHEIRNPIGVINSACSMLGKTGQSAHKQQDLVRMVHEETGRLDHLLKDFQQLARHRRPEFQAIDPLYSLDRALRLALAARDDIKVERAIEHGEERISADAQLLQQAWLNLITNAIQAMGPSGGTLKVHSSLEGDEVVVALEDSGPGVPVELMPRLFEPFFTTKTQGTGLGLTIANTLVEANEGRLELQTPESGGARFAMRFPVTTRSE
jgi:signal transduction histidine kinase